MKVTLLPNYFKKIGLITGFLAFVSFVVFDLAYGTIPFSYDRELVSFICKDLIVVSLLFIAFANEKEHVKNLNSLRFEKLKQAIIFGAVILIYDSISEIIFRREEMAMESGYEIMITSLLFYIVTFHFEKNNMPQEKNKP